MNEKTQIPEPKLMEDGKIMLSSPRQLIDWIEPRIPYMDHDSVAESIKQLSGAIRRLVIEYGSNNSEYQALDATRQRLYRRLKVTSQYKGESPMPNALIRNSFLTPEIMSEYGIVVKDFKNILAQSRYMLDVLGWYVKKYLNAGGNNALISREKTGDWDCYVIKDSFDNICKSCNATEEDRKKLKDILFGKTRPLERIRLLSPELEGGKRRYLDMRFISSRIESGTESPATGKIWTQGSGENRTQVQTFSKIDMVVLEVNATLYEFLQREIAQIDYDEKKDRSGGFQYRPLAMQSKIRDIIKEAEVMSNMSYLKDTMKLDMSKVNQKVVASCVEYSINKWVTGSEKRTGHMIITLKELVGKGLYPTLGKKSIKDKYQRRYREMDLISRVLNHFKESMHGCYAIFLLYENNELQLLFVNAKAQERPPGLGIEYQWPPNITKAEDLP
jgi:hypothetical protein